MKNTITYSVVNTEGEETFFDVPVDKALKDIKDLINISSKWLYVDQNPETAETITAEKLLAGTVIAVTGMMGGG